KDPSNKCGSGTNQVEASEPVIPYIADVGEADKGLESKKVAHASSSSNVEQFTQLPKHEGEGPIEDLIKDSPPHLEPSTLPSQALDPPAPYPCRIGSQRAYHMSKILHPSGDD
ncbi:hypothetical protein ACLOJK_013733, partial [Asimina triloba]